jgi:hypothetical protein
MTRFNKLFDHAIMVSFCVSVNPVSAQKASNDAVKIGKIKFPYEFKYEGNPLSRIHSAADPDVQVWDGVVWMYCSQDRNVDSTKHKHH